MTAQGEAIPARRDRETLGTWSRIASKPQRGAPNLESLQSDDALGPPRWGFGVFNQKPRVAQCSLKLAFLHPGLT
jgi:hypothetical protein